MAGEDPCFVREGQQIPANILDEPFMVAAGDVGPSDALGEECIPAKDHAFRGTVEAQPARGVAGSDIDTARQYRRMCETFAHLLGAVVIFVNRVGFEDGLCFWGGSMVVGPDGNRIAEAPMLDEALTMATVDLDDLRRQRLIAPLGRDERLLVVIEELNRIKRQRYDS